MVLLAQKISTNQILRKIPRNVRRVLTPSREGDKGGVGLFIMNLQMIWLSTNQILRKMPRNVRHVLTPSREGDKGGGSFHREPANDLALN